MRKVSPYYSPGIGRFISEDPIRDGLNWYVYCSNNPINRIDPMGTDDYTIQQLQYLLNLKVNYQKYNVPVEVAAAQGDVYREQIKKSPMMEKVYFRSLVEEAFGDGRQGSVEQVRQLIYVANANTALEKVSADQDDTMTMEQHNWLHSTDAVQNSCVYQITVAEMQEVCFDGETLIQTAEGHKRIKDIVVGDYVYSKNERTGERGLKKVVQTFENKTNAIVHLQIGTISIKTTATHPFWVDGKGWISAINLIPGNKVITSNGTMELIKEVSVEMFDELQTVYNFEVEDWHTYFVTELEIWVHNACAPGNAIVYFGVDTKGVPIYVGITNDIVRRQNQHGDRFTLVPITSEIPRFNARAIEQGLIEANPGFENKINSISPKNPKYPSAQQIYQQYEEELKKQNGGR